MEMKNKLYITRNKTNWESIAKKDYNVLPCDYQVIQKGFILPLRCDDKIDNRRASVSYMGGVINKEKRFVAGFRRHDSDFFNHSMNRAYSFNEQESSYSDTRVIYGGVILDIFGHCLTETLSRLWYLKETDERLPIVFCSKNLKYHIPSYFYDMMELLGIDQDRIIIAKTIVQYKEIIVPDQAIMLYIGYNSKLCNVYDLMKYNACKLSKKNYDKVYLSRNKFSRGDCINEDYFEQFYMVRGYEIVYPEVLPFFEQVAMISRAGEIVCTGGTLSHLLLYASENCKVTILLRCNEAEALIPQFNINQFKNLDVTWIDVSCSFLPTTHAGGIFLIGPTQDFVDYLRDENIYFDETDVVMDYEKTAWKYVMAWINWYSAYGYAYKRVKALDFFDIVNTMSMAINHKELNRESMHSPDRYRQCKQLEIIENKYKVVESQKRYIAAILGNFFENTKFKNDKIVRMLEKEIKQPFVIWKMHVAHKGWLDWCVQDEKMDISKYSNYQMEALCIEIVNDSVINVNYYVYSKKEGWSTKTSSGKIAGTVGKSDPIIAVKVEMSGKNDFDIMYRVGYHDKWSRWYSDGEETDMNMFPYLERIELKIVSVKESKKSSVR